MRKAAISIALVFILIRITPEFIIAEDSETAEAVYFDHTGKEVKRGFFVK